MDKSETETPETSETAPPSSIWNNATVACTDFGIFWMHCQTVARTTNKDRRIAPILMKLVKTKSCLYINEVIDKSTDQFL